MADQVSDLLAYLDRSPTPYHAAREAALRLSAAGFREVNEQDLWNLSPGAKHFVVRGGSSLIAFQTGAESAVDTGFRIVTAHTDSPNLRLKPHADYKKQGYQQLGVEVYGGALLHTWLDRDLALAGRVTLRGEDGVRSVLVDFERPLARVPSLAIHLNRDVNREGLKLNAQDHLAPVVGLEDSADLRRLIVTELRARKLADTDPDGILAFDLMFYDSQRASVGGACGEFIQSGRIDNLVSCHAAVTALAHAAEAELPDFTRVVALYDHEEVGSRSAQGAQSSLLLDTLTRTIEATKESVPQGLPRAASRSFMISADMAHAVHPNYPDRHDPQHHPKLGGGPVIKTHASQAYATDATTHGLFQSICERVEVETQQFVSRSDLPCGSTVGPISAARLGIRTVDVGSPMLSMHSCREMCGTADVQPMIAVLKSYFSE